MTDEKVILKQWASVLSCELQSVLLDLRDQQAERNIEGYATIKEWEAPYISLLENLGLIKRTHQTIVRVTELGLKIADYCTC